MKLFEIQASDTTKTIDEALKLAQETGVLQVPKSALCLTIASGKPVEVENGEES